MFELPAVLPQDHEQEASRYTAKANFRSMEMEEIKRILSGTHPSPNHPHCVEKVKRKVYLKGAEEVEEYIGLVSHTVFNSNGDVIGDTFSEAQAIVGGARIYPKTLLDTRKKQDESLEEVSETLNDSETVLENRNENETEGNSFYTQFLTDSQNKASTVAQQIVTWFNGVRHLPRNTCKPQVLMDDPITQRFVHEAQFGVSQNLSENSSQVLMRSNYRAPFGLKFCHTDDQWHNQHYLRRRSLQVVTNILYICLERRDYERSWNALSCLIREKHVDVRLLWMPALELLAWRQCEHPTSKSPDDFLNWLIVNFPNLPQSRAYMHRPRPRSIEFMPVSIMIKLANGKYSDAMLQAEQAVNSAQYANDAACWALCGLATMKLNRDNDKAIKCFKKCLDLGGVLPRQLKIQASQLCSEDSPIKEAFFEGSDTEIEEDSESESELENETVDERKPTLDSEESSEKDSSTTSDAESDEEVNETSNVDIDRNGAAQQDHESEEEVIMTSDIGPSEIGPSEAGPDNHDSEVDGGEEETDGPARKKVRADGASYSSDSEGPQDRFEDEPPSSQPFYSQALTIGAEMGSSDSDDDMP